MTEWNFPGVAFPRVQRIVDEPMGETGLAERDKLIVDMGHKLTPEYIEETYQVAVDRTALEPSPVSAMPGALTQGESGAELAEDEEDSVDVRREQARRVVGPLVDRWIDAVHEQLDNSDSLGGFRERLDTEVDIDVGPVARELGWALVAAVLAGRFDVDAPFDLELAEFASFEHNRLPFAEQIAFFRVKLNLPTATWTDLWDEGHDEGFVIAGAMRVALLEDLRTAVDSAIAEGTTLATFRSHFDATVAKHGWSYNGGRDWRMRVIYDTNLRQSYAAGRWRQLEALKEMRPYLALSAFAQVGASPGTARLGGRG